MQELANNSGHSSLSGTAVKQSSEGSRNLVCTLASIRRAQEGEVVSSAGSEGQRTTQLNLDSFIRGGATTAANL